MQKKVKLFFQHMIKYIFCWKLKISYKGNIYLHPTGLRQMVDLRSITLTPLKYLPTVDTCNIPGFKILRKGPLQRTFTGQDVVEITCHNNQFLIEASIDRALESGARLAGNGEFAQRAVALGKMDLVQAEAMNDLIHAQTAESLKYSLGQLEGTFSSWIASVEQAVLEMLAFCEASFEFLDEEMEFSQDIERKMLRLIEKVKELLKTYLCLFY